MFFSIVIPTFNRRALLPQTLDSIWTQSFSDFEIILVDDGSTDGTLEYLRSLGNRVRVLTQTNRGPGTARNAGAAAAQGQYLAFLDSDDLWFPWTLETYAAVIRQLGEPSFIAGKPFRFQRDAELTDVVSTPVKMNHFADYLTSGSEWRWWGVSSFVILRNVFQAAGGFTTEWVNGEDADLALRLGTAPRFAQITEPPTFGYREHAGSAMKNFSKTLAGAWLSIKAGKKRGVSRRNGAVARALANSHPAYPSGYD